MPEHDTIDHGPLIHTAFGFKNKIIGGDFHTNPWQRGTSFESVGNVYTADRWKVYRLTEGAVSLWKFADGPTVAEAGIYSPTCLLVDVTTADASIGADQYVVLTQAIEGYNAAPFGFGQAGTRYVTLSFWVKATKTGTYCVAFRNSAHDRSYIAEYTVNSSDTWEKKTITIPVDTSGTWLYTDGVGLHVVFILAAGSNRQTTANSWQAGDYIASTNQVNALDSADNNFKIALVQLEEGEEATDFEQRSIQQELLLCLRYFQKSYSRDIYAGAVTEAGRHTSYGSGWILYQGTIYPNVILRASPTITIYSTKGQAGYVYDQTAEANVAAFGSYASERVFSILSTGLFVANHLYHCLFTLNAEL